MFPAQNLQTTHKFCCRRLIRRKIFNQLRYQYTETNTLILIGLFFFVLYKGISTRDGQITSTEDGNDQVA